MLWVKICFMGKGLPEIGGHRVKKFEFIYLIFICSDDKVNSERPVTSSIRVNFWKALVGSLYAQAEKSERSFGQKIKDADTSQYSSPALIREIACANRLLCWRGGRLLRSFFATKIIANYCSHKPAQCCCNGRKKRGFIHC